MVGAGIAAVTSGRFRVRLDGAKNLPGGSRMALAIGGGILTGFGARLRAAAPAASGSPAARRSRLPASCS